MEDVRSSHLGSRIIGPSVDWATNALRRTDTCLLLMIMDQPEFCIRRTFIDAVSASASASARRRCVSAPAGKCASDGQEARVSNENRCIESWMRRASGLKHSRSDLTSSQGHLSPNEQNTSPAVSEMPAEQHAICACDGATGHPEAAFCSKCGHVREHVEPFIRHALLSYYARGGESVISGEEQVTSMMICNIPCRMGIDRLIHEIDRYGFVSKYDLVFMPAPAATRRKRLCGMSRPTAQNLGFAFVNFKDARDAKAFGARFLDVCFAGSHSTKLAFTKPAGLQGFRALLERNVKHIGSCLLRTFE